jgi:hypothetical protein
MGLLLLRIAFPRWGAFSLIAWPVTIQVAIAVGVVLVCGMLMYFIAKYATLAIIYTVGVIWILVTSAYEVWKERHVVGED